jgi:hypothetical protein
MSDDEEYKKAIRQRALDLMSNPKEKAPKKTRAKKNYSEEQREKMLERLATMRRMAVSVRSEKKAINDAIKAEMKDDFEAKKKKYLSNPPDKGKIDIDSKPSKIVKAQPIIEPKDKRLPIPPQRQQTQQLPPPQPVITPQQAPPQPPPQQAITPQPVKATYFRPTMKFYNKYGNNYD